MPRTILVTGGSGTLGSVVTDRLVRLGEHPVVMSRSPRPDSVAESVGWARADLRSGEGVTAAVDGMDVIIHCASSQNKADIAAARQLFEAARQAGGPHVVYISIVGVDVVPFGYYQAKLEVEQLLADSGLPWTTLRATQFHEFVAALFTAQRLSPFLAVPAGIDVQPVTVGEVADRLVELASGEAAGRVDDMGGPEVRPVTDLAHAYLRTTGSRRPVLPVPLPGRTARAFKEGGHLCPAYATGRGTFEEFLADRGGSTGEGAPG